jgi:hypothetical protein
MNWANWKRYAADADGAALAAVVALGKLDPDLASMCGTIAVVLGVAGTLLGVAHATQMSQMKKP